MLLSAVKKEAKRNEEMIRQYQERISELPKGSLSRKKTGYYYLKYRAGDAICDQYVGKDPSVIDDLNSKIEERRHCENMLRALRNEQKQIRRVLEGLK